MPKPIKQNPMGNGPAARLVPNRAAPTPTNRFSAAADGILAEGISVGDLRDDWIRMCLYGQNRVGKTTLACQFPKPLALVAFDPAPTGGAKSVKKVEGVTYYRVGLKGTCLPDGTVQGEVGTARAMRLAEAIAARRPFKTVVIDSATSFQDIILAEILDLANVPVQLNWGTVSRDQYRQRAEKTKEALRPFVNLPCHVVVIAKERDHNPQDRDRPELVRDRPTASAADLGIGESFLAADLGGATASWLHDVCDYIGRLYVAKEVVTTKKKVKVLNQEREVVDVKETGKLVRRLRTLYHPNVAAGFRSENPEVIPEYVEEPTWEKINDLIQGKRLR